MWEKYVENQENKNKETIENVKKNKKKGNEKKKE